VVLDAVLLELDPIPLEEVVEYCEDAPDLGVSSTDDEVEDVVEEYEEGKNLDRGVIVDDDDDDRVSREREREEFNNAEVLSVVDDISSFFAACSL